MAGNIQQSLGEAQRLQQQAATLRDEAARHAQAASASNGDDNADRAAREQSIAEMNEQKAQQLELEMRGHNDDAEKLKSQINDIEQQQANLRQKFEADNAALEQKKSSMQGGTSSLF